MESTMSNAFRQAATLRRWIHREDCPPAIKKFKILFDRAFTSRLRSEVQHAEDGTDQSPPCVTTVVDNTKHKLSETPAELYPFVKTHRIVLHAYAHHLGMRYARCKTHVGNSLVFFYPKGDKSLVPVPGSIQWIFSTESDTSTRLLAILQYAPLPTSTSDPFRLWPHLPLSLYSAEFKPVIEVVELDWVIGHAALYVFSPTTVALFSLARNVSVELMLPRVSSHVSTAMKVVA